METPYYPTRPIECWGKMKELRRKLFKRSWEVRQNGGVAVATQQMCHPLVAGIGPAGRRLYGPYFSKAMREPSIVVQYHQAAEAYGFPRGEMCSSMHHYLGEMLLGLTTRDPITGGKSPVDFVLDMEFCHSVAKTAQLAGEWLGVPHFVLDIPQEGGAAAVEYIAAQMHDCIDWMIQVTGKEYHDEWLIEAARNWWEQGALWSRICWENRAIPAPLDYRQLHALFTPSVVGGHDPEVVEFFQLALDEVQERVRDGISALGAEACRLTHEGEPMYYAEPFVPKIAQRFGAIFIGGFTAFSSAHWDISPDGHWEPAPRFKELGVELKSREDALRLLASCYAEHTPIYHCQRIYEKLGEYRHRAQDWHCQGAVLHLDIGCRSQAMGVLEAKKVLDEAGIPTLTYEASNGDPRDFTAHQVQDRLESYLERLGLQRLPEVPSVKGPRPAAEAED